VQGDVIEFSLLYLTAALQAALRASFNTIKKESP